MPGQPDPASDVTFLKDLKIGMRNLNTHVIVLETGPRPVTTKEGVEVRSCKVADKTACINVTVPDQDMGSHIQPGDICRITKCFASNQEGPLTLHLGKGGTLTKVSDFSMIFNEGLNMSEPTTPGAPGAAAAPTAAVAGQATQIIPPVSGTAPLVAATSNNTASCKSPAV